MKKALLTSTLIIAFIGSVLAQAPSSAVDSLSQFQKEKVFQYNGRRAVAIENTSNNNNHIVSGNDYEDFLSNENYLLEVNPVQITFRQGKNILYQTSDIGEFYPQGKSAVDPELFSRMTKEICENEK